MLCFNGGGWLVSEWSVEGRIGVVVLFPAEVVDGDVAEESGVSGHYEKRYD